MFFWVLKFKLHIIKRESRFLKWFHTFKIKSNIFPYTEELKKLQIVHSEYETSWNDCM